jgi:acetylornithine deacetylase/succinyl-diaminopimelate desuccinylase-like protein
VTADEETGAQYGAHWLCDNHPDKVRCDMLVNEGGGEVLDFDGLRIYDVCVAEKGVFRFTVSTRGVAGHASIPRIGDNALLKLAPLLDRLAAAGVVPELTPEPAAYLAGLGLEVNGDLTAAFRALEAKDPRLAVLVEPMLGVTFTPTMVRASDKINVIPSRAEIKVDCRVPPQLGEDYARARIEEALAGEEYDLSFDEQVVGNRSSFDTPLMGHIRDFLAEEDPGSVAVPSVLPGFTDSRWWRDAFPDCVAYGFCPQSKMDIFEATPLIHGADERIPVEDLGLAARFYAGLAPKVLG